MARHRRSGLEHKQVRQQLAVEPLCTLCGQRLGKHRYGTDQCPNDRWRPGNGQPQWNDGSFTEPATCEVNVL